LISARISDSAVSVRISMILVAMLPRGLNLASIVSWYARSNCSANDTLDAEGCAKLIRSEKYVMWVLGRLCRAVADGN
jgi:hypothetical protein